MPTNLRKHTSEVAEIINHRIRSGLRRLRLLPGFGPLVEPSQRADYFSDFEMALRFDAIEAGILPVAQALYELGAQTKYSCEGHAEGEYPSYPYLACWLTPELARTLPQDVQQVLHAPLKHAWHIETEDSMGSSLRARESGTPGLYLTLRGVHRPMSAGAEFDASPEPVLNKEWVTSDLAEIARRLNALERPRRMAVGKREDAVMTRIGLAMLLTGPLLVYQFLDVIGYWTLLPFQKLGSMLGKRALRRFASQLPEYSLPE